MTPFHYTFCLLSLVTIPNFAHAQELSLPQLGGENALIDSFNTRSDSASRIISGYSSIDYLELGKYDSIVVEYFEPSENPFSDGQNQAAAASLGVTATQITPNSFELQISSQPIAASEFGVAAPELFQKRAAALAKILDADETVEDWFPNYKVNTQDVTDPLYPQQWHYFPHSEILENGKFPGGTDLSLLWEYSSGNEDVVVAVLDTGFLYDHEDATNVLPGYDFVSDIAAANDGDGWDNDAQDPGDACGPLASNSWHGSHVAGTIGALAHNGVGAVGINKNVSIIPVRVLGKCGGDFNDIMTAVLWSADLLDAQTLLELGLPRVPKKANVINMSLGGPGRCTQAWARNFQRVAANGTLVVVAAGNDARDARDFVPASCPGVIVVAASDMSGSLVSRYSNYGPLVSIMAPGGDIEADFDGNGFPDGVLSMVANDYAFSNGTSMAAPHVSGLAAHIFALDPNISPADVANLMINFGKERTSEQCPKNCGPLLNAGFLLPK
ncbi:S8 family peptidase [Ruegeria atlantica]|uniref:S8 family serine peptidase n=1 Tax=Ruegeria atlantica TaxID=81569 RepID=A0ABX1WHS0_9RHOB|nr:S8 family peptidase [Ruegeria atlantica]NOD32888.1 S8 family serine peptidase [Ruegeria atlantica]